MKVTFLERFGAYIIDFLIISVIASIVCIGAPSKDNEMEKQMKELANSFTEGTITNEEYAKEYIHLTYVNKKHDMLTDGVGLVLSFAYFVIFQYMNKGQTLGKKLLKLRVVDKDTKKPTTIIKGLIRTIIPYGIVTSLISLILISILKESTYMSIYVVISTIELLFIIVTVLFVLYRKDGRGLHDIMANTTVIKEGRG